jgi:hypothetical protein
MLCIDWDDSNYSVLPRSTRKSKLVEGNKKKESLMMMMTAKVDQKIFALKGSEARGFSSVQMDGLERNIFIFFQRMKNQSFYTSKY